MSMSEIRITDSAMRSNNIMYIYGAILEIVTQMNAKMNVVGGNSRSGLHVIFPDSYKELFIEEVEDKIADVIAVNYKYSYFSKNVVTVGLNEMDRELMMTALISADLEEDKKYIIKKLKAFDEYAIDGIYHFRLLPLINKWEEIVSYIPSGFKSGQLTDFISYLIKDKRGKKVLVENGKVYDRHYNLLKRRNLLGGSEDSIGVIKEIILSGCGEVELASRIPIEDEEYLKRFYGDKITFAGGYFSGKK